MGSPGSSILVFDDLGARGESTAGESQVAVMGYNLCVMKRDQLNAIASRVREVADRIQPLLEPHPGLAARNAHAHIWLGIKLRFGESWRSRATHAGVCAFIEWIDSNPNADYEEFPGPIELREPEQGLFGALDA
jgi:hypothetical protein